MPGRKYTPHAPHPAGASLQSVSAPAAPKRPAKRRKTNQRILNAFSIAQHTADDEYVPRRSRLGEIERGFESDDEDQDGSENDDGETNRKRKRVTNQNQDGVERGSDSEGNEWIIGAGSDDSDIDSDAADGNAGEGEAGDEDGEDSDAESEGFAAEAVDLADMLDQSSGSEEESASEEEDIDLADVADDMDSKKLAQLQSMLVSMDDQGATRRTQLDLAQEAATPSEYGLAPKQKLSVADLMATISDPAFKKSLKVLAGDSKKSKVSGVPGKLSAPLPQRQQDRIDRVAAFEKSKETLSRWIETVKHNRRAEHLVFPLVDQDVEAAKSTKRILPGAIPANELESTIQKILIDSGLEPGRKQEEEIQKFEELATNSLPIEEARARQAELRRARDLLFREEIRAKRIKKIKSKAYRRVHRKERQKNGLSGAGLENSEDEQERLDRQRAAERMGQRHRENRWVKSVKDSGRAKWDNEARDDVAAMLRQDEDLKRKMHGRGAGSESESESEPSDEDDEAFTQRIRNNLTSLSTADSVQESKLSSMKFMKKAEAARKAKNDEMAEMLRRDLNGETLVDSDSEAEKPAGRKTFGPKKQLKGILKTKSKRAEFEEGQESDTEASEQDNVEILTSSTTGTNVNAKAKTTKSSKVEKPLPKQNGKNNKTGSDEQEESPFMKETLSADGNDDENPFMKPQKQRKGRQSESSIPFSSDGVLSKKQNNSKSTQSFSSHPKTKTTTETSLSTLTENIDSDSDDSTSNSSNPKMSKTLDLRALVNETFAGNSETTFTDFTTEKALLAATEAPQDPSTSNNPPGWGSWTGPGLSRKDKRASALSRTPAKAAPANANRKDRNLARVIISEKRAAKTAKYLASSLPHPFESQAQYERSLRLPIGPEFTTKLTFQNMTKPRVLVKGGVVAPMRRPLVSSVWLVQVVQVI